MSSPSGSDWWRPQFYQQDHSNQEISNRSVVFDGDQGSEEATVVSSSAGRASSSVGGGGHLSPEGRVGKPAVRRRTRASRRTPTTLLNTDTKNFRAMVQQFTGATAAAAGGPTTAPFAPGAHPGDGPNLVFGIGSRQPHVNPGSLMAAPAVFHLQYQQQQPQFQHQNRPYMFSLNNNNPGAGDLLLQRGRGNPRPNMESGSEGFVLEGVPSQFPPTNNFLQ